jgi:hypothetical protein
MMQRHRIHLKGPWECEWLEPIDRSNDHLRSPDRHRPGTAATPVSLRVKMPVDWRKVFGCVAGRIRFRRRFGRPTNLGPDERLFVVFDGIGGMGNVWLGRRKLGQVDSHQTTARFELTGLLETRNELVVELRFDPEQSPGQPGGLWGPVAIEIQQQ